MVQREGVEPALARAEFQDGGDLRGHEEQLATSRTAFEEVTEVASKARVDLEAASGNVNAVAREHENLSRIVVSLGARATQLQQEIEKEYAKEFIAEGQLFYYHKRLNELIINKTAYDTYNVTPTVYTLPRPDDENTYGGRTE